MSNRTSTGNEGAKPQLYNNWTCPFAASRPGMDSNMSYIPTDTKPDISQLESMASIHPGGAPGAFSSGASGTGRYPPQGGYNPSSGGPPGYSAASDAATRYFDMGIMGATGGDPRNTARVSSPPHSSQSSTSPGSGGGHSPGVGGASMGGPGFNIGTGGSMSPSGLGGAGFLGSTKHLCAICGDRASGKHYGVYSCEGCKGFFKRTVRKDLQYACRDEKHCVVDKRQRNRCQYCRYIKCLNTGMKREAVQEERQRAKERGEADVESTSSSANSDMPVELILEAELATDPPQMSTYQEPDNDPIPIICRAADKQLFSLVDWAKRVPHFTGLPVEDQVILLRAGWNELLIAGFSHRSTAINDGILLATGVRIHRDIAHTAGVGVIFDRVLTELVTKMREMSMDKTELGCLRAVVLFNPDSKGLKSVVAVESLREKVYASLEEYTKLQYPDEPSRFAKLLLRLPALRSIGLKCIEHLFFYKLIGDTPLDSFLLEMLEGSSAGS